jgi:hypothetical protein
VIVDVLDQRMIIEAETKMKQDEKKTNLGHFPKPPQPLRPSVCGVLIMMEGEGML